MKKLTYYKSQYARRKTQKGKSSVMNSAMLNLSYADQQAFIKWQTKRLTDEA